MRLKLDRCRRVTNDLAGFDSNQYQITVVPSELGGRDRFHVGEVIRVKWKAPPNHSRKDWIGIYRVRPCSLRFRLPDSCDSVGWGKQERVRDRGCHDGDVGARTRGRMGWGHPP